MVLRSQIVGVGGYLPERVVTNRDLASRLDTSDEWIRQRTGIGERRMAAEGELTSDLAVRAAERALADAGMSAGDLDLIVLATATPDHTFPATATKVQAGLGMHRGAAFDVQAVCAGFIFALATADNALRLGQARTALVIGAETFSRILDWEDRGTCVLFGDGAGALALQGVADTGPGGRGVLSTHLHSDGRQYDILYVDGGPSSTGTDRPSADGRPRGVPPSGAASRRGRRGSARRERARRGGYRLVGAAPGEQPHHRRGRHGGSACRPPRSFRRSSDTPIPRPPRSRWPWRRRSPTAASAPAIWC